MFLCKHDSLHKQSSMHHKFDSVNLITYDKLFYFVISDY